MTLKILQGNMHRSKVAHDLLPTFCASGKADIALISEQYRTARGNGWYSDQTETAAIWVPDTRRTPVSTSGAGRGYVWVKTCDTTFVSCYLTPSGGIGKFEETLNDIEDFLRNRAGPFVVAGDFNAKAIEWGEQVPDSRGTRLLDMTSRTGLIVLNTGNTTTCRKIGCRGTIPDVSFASETIVQKVRDWKVNEEYNASDHQYITFRILGERFVSSDWKGTRDKWNVDKIDKERLSTALERRIQNSDLTIEGASPLERAERLAGVTMSIIKEACQEAVPKRRQNVKRHPAYWWTSLIAELRKKCHRTRRIAQRARKRDADFAQKNETFKAAKKELRRAINESKSNRWWELGEDINRDTWGKGYKIVARKIGAMKNEAPLDANIVETIVDSLFPTHEDRPLSPTGMEPLEVPLFTATELTIAVRGMKNGKAPGPDGLPSEILKAVAGSHPQLLLNMYNTCLKEGIFYSKWKEARLVLINKGKGDTNAPSSYRPLCMLDTAGKLLERLLRPRLQAAIKSAGDLSKNQYGFRTGLSTIDAVQKAVEVAKSVERGNHYSRAICLLCLLDVKNAFNSVRWADALEEMRERFRIPKYLLKMLSSYLRDRYLRYDTDEGTKERRLTAGAAQGSVLGGDVWNIDYDGLLTLEMPEGAKLIAYADDVAVLIIARDVEKAQFIINQVMRRVLTWMRSRSLQVAEPKTEILILTKKHIDNVHSFRVNEAVVTSKPSVKYLGITLDTKMNFWDHIGKAADKAAFLTATLSRIMANVKGPWPSKRRILLRTAESIMLYGAEVWADALKFEMYRKRMASVQRRAALRVICSYRTVSEIAAIVVAGIVPIDLLAFERKFVHREKNNVGVSVAKKTAREQTMQEWQDRWVNAREGRWTARLIPQVDVWIDRKHGEVNYYLTQFLTGHGLFRSYLHKMGKVREPTCVYCGDPKDDARHTFFVCERWSQYRAELDVELGPVTETNIVGLMLQNSGTWRKVATFVETILRKKKIEEDQRQEPRGQLGEETQ